MFESSLKIGRIRGIRIQIHFTWLVIFALLSFSLVLGFQALYPDWTTAATLAAALMAVVLFFASIVLHELGHSLVAIRRGVPVRSITLFIFGGVAQLERDSENARDEFWIAIAGPLVSLALAVLFWLLSQALGALEWLAVAFGWLALINFIVAVFNLVPGFPLDGGRVLRAIVWGLTGDAHKGMLWAIAGGRVIAFSLILLGLLFLLARGELIGGLWLVALGWFLLNAAEASRRDFGLRQALGDLRAADVMEREPPLVPAGTSVAEWVERHVLPESTRAWLVGHRDAPRGLVTLSDSRRVDREAWPSTPVEEIMTPFDRLKGVEVDEELQKVLQLMGQERLNQIPVLEGGRIAGWIDRDHLLRCLQVRMELKGQGPPGR